MNAGPAQREQRHRHPERSEGSLHASFYDQSQAPFSPKCLALQHRSSFVAKLLRLTALVAAATLTGCKSTPPPKPLAELTAQERAGHAAYLANCAQCHYDRQDGALHGPSLLGVYKDPYLPSGAPANDDRIRNTILHGRGNMPALGGSIGDDSITDILAYLKTL